MLRSKMTFSLVLVILLIPVNPGAKAQLPAQPTYDAGFSAPVAPNLYAFVDHKTVVLSWDNRSETSVDSLTGYADFEGYKVYRSRDGGITWGTDEDKIYDYEGTFIGWEPIAQFDLSEENDIKHCIYSDSTCGDEGNRGIEISGYDSYQPRNYLGNNSGLRYTYTDSNIVDGIEYTYSVTAYDLGIRAYKIVYVVNGDSTGFRKDTVWSPTNPDRITALNGEGFRSLESPKGASPEDHNFITVIPGYRASNISFPSQEDVNSFLVEEPGVVGNGLRQYALVDENNLSDAIVRFEIDAEMADDAFLGLETKKAMLYAYEIDNIDSQIPVSTTTYDISGMGADTITQYLDLPGADTSSGLLQIPNYLFQDPLNEWSDIFDGIRVKYTNIPASMPAEGSGFEVIHDLEWHADSLTQQSVGFDMWYINSTVYSQSPNFDYKIEFFTSTVDTAAGTSPATGCSVWPGGRTHLPFRITNITTGKQVAVKHSDNGIDGTGSLLNPDVPGYKDCIWTSNEKIQFFIDSLSVGSDTVFNEEKTYDFWMDINWISSMSSATGSIPSWNDALTYDEGDIVFYEGMVWIATEDINSFIVPTDFIDDNGDIVNDNPWSINYPWDDGDYVIIRTRKSFVDGDAWTADLSLLGQSQAVKQSILKEITVVPNPYIVRSRFNETTAERRIRFTHLPQKCRISIFTITGEIVSSFKHDSEYDGNAWWDLTTDSGSLIGPGLYIYYVEAENVNHVGKFAIVR